jgi:hypothetical protein
MGIRPLDERTGELPLALAALTMIQPLPPRHPGPIDVLMLASALVAAILISRVDPSTLETRLHLPPTMAARAGEEAMIKDVRIAGTKGLGFQSLINRVRWFLRDLLKGTGTPILVLITPGVALATYRSRWMFRRRSRRGVGVLTTTIAGAMVVVYLSNEYILRRLSEIWKGYGNNPLSFVWREIAEQVSVAILAMWIVLAIGRRWRAEPHWRDRLGRALGMAWIGYWFVNVILSPLLRLPF